ncbi:flagella basal body P-ring formation protein FlgA [Croceibacterium xixiisoli]
MIRSFITGRAPVPMALATMGLATAAPLAAAAFADPVAIDQAVAQFTGMPIGAPGGARTPVDRRLRLAACPQPFALEWYGSRRDNVLVQCPVPNGWRIFVPVQAEPRAAAAQKAPDAVARGESVNITVSGRGFTLSRQGEALESGAVGDWIRVRQGNNRNDSVRARIIRPGVVGMDLP